MPDLPSASLSPKRDSSGGYMQIAVEQTLGRFLLSVSCELVSPWTVLFGPSGSGKSSLLRVLGGLRTPEERRLQGTVVFRGETLLDTRRKIWVAPAKRRIGFAVQRAALFPHLSVYNNIGFGLQGLAAAEHRDRIAQMLDLFALDPLAQRRPANLSGGERQRVALARALAPEPAMLLLDEPFTGLDTALKESILEKLMLWLDQRRVPALYVSHDVTEAFLTKADVLVLRNGKIEAQGPCDVVLAGERERILRNLHRTLRPSQVE